MSPRTVPVALALVLLAGCGDDDTASSDATTTTAAAQESTTTSAGDTTTTGAEEPSTTTTAAAPVDVLLVQVEQGEPLGGALAADVALDEEITIRVEADVTDEVHVHGYDLTADVAPGAPAEITFVADIPGQFEVELEGTGTLIIELTVS